MNATDQKLLTALLSHYEHAYRKTDGTMDWPNSREGDILRGSHGLLVKMRPTVQAQGHRNREW